MNSGWDNEITMTGTIFTAGALSTALLALASGTHAKTPIKICWEAESIAQIHKPLRRIWPSRVMKVSAPKPWGAPSEGYVQMPWVANHRNGSATYQFRVIAPGTYYVWMRLRYVSPFSNRLYFSGNGGLEKPLGEGSSYNTWHWASGASRIRCHQGINTLVLKNLDMGIKVDQILLSSDPDFIPTGIQQTTQ